MREHRIPGTWNAGAAMLALMLLGVSPALAEPAGNTHRLKVLTLNVGMLPGAIASPVPSTDYRAEQIAQYAFNAGFDVVAVQECFDDDSRRILVKRLRELWATKGKTLVQVGPSKGPLGGTWRDGGILILTHLRLVGSGIEVFDQCGGKDCLATKGVVHAQVQTEDGATIGIYATHTQAGGDDIKVRQVEEMARFIDRSADPRYPYIIVGDLNIPAPKPGDPDRTSLYHVMRRLFQNTQDVWVTLHPNDMGGNDNPLHPDIAKRINYVFLSNLVGSLRTLDPIRIVINHLRHSNPSRPAVRSLSDHSALEAEFGWRDWPRECVSGPGPWGSKKVVGLARWFSGRRNDNLTTADRDWRRCVNDEIAAHDGYKLTRIEGRIFSPDAPQPEGTVPLRLWFNPAQGDHFTTTFPDWDPRVNNGQRDGYRFVRVEGYVYDPQRPQPAGTIPLRWHRSGDRDDNLTTTLPVGLAGYDNRQVQGYIIPAER